MSHLRTIFAVPALAVAILGCSGATPPDGPQAEPSPEVRPAADDGQLPVMEAPHLEERVMMLALTDRRLYEPYTVTQVLKKSDSSLEVDLTLYLARVGDERGRAVLTGLAFDDQPEVRRAAVFALGELDDELARPALYRAARDADRATGVLAVEALAKIDTPVEEVRRELEALPTQELWARLVPSLFRFEGEEKLATARAALALSDEHLHSRAAYALARDAQPQAADDLRGLLEDSDPWIRGWAARGLGEVGGATDLARLRPLLSDDEAGPTIQALRAGRRLVGDGRAAPAGDWRPLLLELLDDPRPGVRQAALEAAGAWLLDPQLGEALMGRFERGQVWERSAALASLASAGDPAAWGAAERAAGDPRAEIRASAAAAAGELQHLEVARRLAGDDVPLVRIAALQAQLLVLEGPARQETVRRALEDRDPAVRTTALEWLADNPVLPAPELLDGILLLSLERPVEVRMTGIRALVARAQTEPAESPVVVALLQDIVLEERYVVRRAAIEGLVELGEPRVALGEVDSGKEIEVYRQSWQQTSRSRRVTMETDEGDLVLELDCPSAPLTCLNFIQLAAQGFYDGLTWHRVVPDFVVQGGDPRGDGWGGPGYTLRDEINRIRFERGVLGMAHAGADTAGSQFFITLSSQPHLDGGYTAFGRVIEGDEVLDRLMPGSRIERVVVR